MQPANHHLLEDDNVISFDNLAWSPTTASPVNWDSVSRANNGHNGTLTSTPLAESAPRFNNNLLRDNSQGYEFFYNLPHPNRGVVAGLVDRFTSLVSRSKNSSPSTGYSGWSHSGQSFPPAEVARGGGGAADSDLINLSEIFPSTNSGIFFRAPEQSPDSPDPNRKRKPEESTEFFSSMGSMYRSEPMRLVQFIFTKDAAYECVGELGRMGMVQFNDLNQSKNLFQRYFVRDTRRCEEVERKLRFLKTQIQECIPPIIMQSIADRELEIPSNVEVNQMNSRLDELEKDFVELNHNESQLRKNLNEMREYQHVLERVEQFFDVHLAAEALQEIEAADLEPFSMSITSGGFGGVTNDVPLTPLLNESDKGDNAWFVAGVIPMDKRSAFERVLWRACRRTAFVRLSDTKFTVEDPETLDPMEKCVFIVFFKGESLKQIVDKVCDGFKAHQYPCPKTSKERQTSLFETIARIRDLSIIIDTTQKHRFHVLSELAPEIPSWFQKVHIQKAIYHTLNMCTVDTNGFLAAECWVPDNEVDNAYAALQKGLKMSGSDVSPVMNIVETHEAPPTFHRTNKFTKVFQSIVDSYGIASYREVNPAPFTIITFPFLFAVMFGDAAHGLILFLFGLFFVWKEEQLISKRIRDEIFNTFFGGRYIIMLMGLFSIYTGCIYNDAFAKSFNVFGSRWLNPYNSSDLEAWTNADPDKEIYRILDPATAYVHQDGPYPFGVDPIWNIAENRLSFLNSMKMKVSVILGVAQMTFGVFLSLLNHRFFHSWIDIFTNFVPQIIFLSCIFIYLCVQMVAKWIFFSVHAGTVLGLQYPGTFCAPSLLIGLINMFMFKERPEGYVDEEGNHHDTCYLNQWYPYQALIESVLIGVALCCIPIMLLGRPLAAVLDQKKKNTHRKLDNGMEEAQLVTQSSQDAADHNLGDVVVHQAIHTIEFVLGCVSHTASYLRLWALSLAHAQLSEVLWHMVLMSGLSIGEQSFLGSIVAYLVFMAFAVLSLSILVMMEGLSAFLHALRLHWVEFQSKFYQGIGHAFHPYSLHDALEAAQLEAETVEEAT